MIRTVRSALPTLILTTAAVLFTSPPSAIAAPTAYAIAIDPGPDYFSALYTIDLGTAAATRIGSTDHWLDGLAIAPDGTLYAPGLFTTLYRVDPTTGAATPVATGPAPWPGAADFASSTLIAADLTLPTTIYAIDTATAATTFLATTDPPRGGAYGLAATGNGRAFLTVTETGGLPQDAIPTTLSTIDLTTGATTDIGVITGHHFTRGIDTDAAGTLYGLDDLGALFTINTATGVTTLVGDTGVRDWVDLAIPTTGTVPATVTAAVPEPGSAMLLAAGLATVGAMAVRRKMALPGG